MRDPALSAIRNRIAVRANFRRLRNLGAEVIDLYYPHFPDPQVPLVDTVGAVAGLVAAGLVRHLGVCNVIAAQLHAVQPVTAVQTQWSMWQASVAELLAAARELGVAWSPLGGGFLTGTGREVAAADSAPTSRVSPRATSQPTTSVTRTRTGKGALL